MDSENYALMLTPAQSAELTAIKDRSQAELAALQESLSSLCPGLDLEKLSDADRERWFNLKNALDEAKNAYEGQIVGLFEDYLREHLLSLGNDPQRISEDAAKRIKFLFFNNGWTPEEIESFMMERYAPLFEDPAAAEDSLRELVKATTGTGKARKRKPLPPLKEYAIMNTRTANTMLNSDPQPVSQSELIRYGFRMESDPSDLWGYAIRQSPQDSKKPPVISYVVLNFQDLGQDLSQDLITSRGKRFSAFDYAVYDAVFNKFRQYRGLFPERETEPLILSSLEIWRTLNGYDIPGARSGNSAGKPTQKQLDEIGRSMLRWGYTRIRMNVNAEIAANYINDCTDWKSKNGIIDSSLLSLTAFTDGNMTMFKITDPPILGVYAERKRRGQILNVPYGMLKLKTSKQGYAVEIGHYLIKRITQMYSGYRDSSRILFSSLYDEGGIVLPEQRVSGTGNERADQTQIRRYYQKDREKVIEILRGWTPDYIRGFSLVCKDGTLTDPESTAGKILIGVEVDLIPEKIKIPINKFIRQSQAKKETAQLKK